VRARKRLFFTSGGTEADNHAIFGVAQALIGAAGTAPVHKHIITTSTEHEAVLNTCQALEKRGVEVSYLPVDRDGLVSLDQMRRAIRKETVLITVMQANNELGTVQPLAEIGRLAAESDLYFHTDAVQSAGKLPIDVNALRLDLLALSGHKFYGPKGVGALYIRGGTRLQQLLYGGHHQRGFRPGTENVAGIVGLGKAAEIAGRSLVEDSARISALRDQLEQGLLRAFRMRGRTARGRRGLPTPPILRFQGLRARRWSLLLTSRDWHARPARRVRLAPSNLRMCSPLLGLRPMRRAPVCDLAWAATPLPPTSSLRWRLCQPRSINFASFRPTYRKEAATRS